MSDATVEDANDENGQEGGHSKKDIERKVNILLSI
jgi:hypothetical protein